MRESPSEAWARCRPYIEGALKHCFGGYSVDDVARGVEDGRYAFFPGRACAIVTEFWEGPQIKALNLWLMGGDLAELRQIYPTVEGFARQHGCREIAGGGLHGKRGWERVTRRLGFEPRWTIYSKELP